MSLSSFEVNSKEINSYVPRVNSFSNFCTGTVLCGGSISSADIIQCNNKYWALQGKAVTKRVWEVAKRMGFEGTLPDDSYVQMIVERESRDEEACRRRVNNDGVP